MYVRTLQNSGETRRFVITGAGRQGWEVTEERDSQVVRRVRYTDWHRVERARMAFAAEVQLLQRAGWTEPTA